MPNRWQFNPKGHKAQQGETSLLGHMEQPLVSIVLPLAVQ